MSHQRQRRSMKLEFRDNPNYVTEFEINLYVTRNKTSYVIDPHDLRAIRDERSSCID